MTLAGGLQQGRAAPASPRPHPNPLPAGEGARPPHRQPPRSQGPRGFDWRRPSMLDCVMLARVASPPAPPSPQRSVPEEGRRARYRRLVTQVHGGIRRRVGTERRHHGIDCLVARPAPARKSPGPVSPPRLFCAPATPTGDDAVVELGVRALVDSGTRRRMGGIGDCSQGRSWSWPRRQQHPAPIWSWRRGWREGVRARKGVTGTRVPPSAILRARDAERRWPRRSSSTAP